MGVQSARAARLRRRKRRGQIDRTSSYRPGGGFLKGIKMPIKSKECIFLTVIINNVKVY